MTADAPTLPNEDWCRIREQPRPGPNTGDVLNALEVLEETAARQQAVTVTRAFPEYDGLPYTGELERLGPGDQMAALGTIDRAGLEHAAEAMAPDRGRHRVARERQAGGRALRVPACWPLLAVLAVQAVLSLRLVWSNTAFEDEALYLWAGHIEWSAWLHHAVPASSYQPFPAYFSGAPVIYPPLGALADSVGGLAGARILSLCFMLAATVFLYDVTRRLFGSRAAIFAAALCAGLGSEQFLGAFATYDAMALMLLTFAAWLGVRGSFSRHPWMAATGAGFLLALADATKYATTLFDPVVIAIVVLTVRHSLGRKKAAAAGALTVAALAFSAVAALLAGGREYWQGIAFTTLSRGAGGAPIPGVLYVSGKWVGAVALLAIIGAAAASSAQAPQGRALGWVLAAAVFLAPAEQARIHTITSLFKHVGYGAWFGCIVGGYALASLARAVPAAKFRRAQSVSLVAALLAGAVGFTFSGAHFSSWPNATRMIEQVRPVLARYDCPCMLTENNAIDYYLQGAKISGAVVNAYFFRYQDPQTGRNIGGIAAYQAAIGNLYFRVVEVDPSENDVVYEPVVHALASTAGYRLVGSSNSGIAGEPAEVWVREGGAR